MSNNNYPNNLTKISTSSINKKSPAFKGIVDEAIGRLSPNECKNLERYILGIGFVSFDEKRLAKRISDYTLDDWPSGLRDKYSKGMIPLEYCVKPKTVIEYRKILLKQNLNIPPKPKLECSYFDKLFNTKTWKEYQKSWEDYIYRMAYLERIENLASRFSQKKYNRLTQKFNTNYQGSLNSVFSKYKLNKDFISLFNSSKSDTNLLPNAILIESTSQHENKDIIKWLFNNSIGNKIYIENKNSSSKDKIQIMNSALEMAKEYNKKTGHYTLMYIENFDNLVAKNKENTSNIADLKDILSNLQSEYKTTLIYETDNSQKIYPEILQKHRTGLKINLNKTIPSNEFKVFQHDYIKANTIPMSTNDNGYRMNYLPDKKIYIDLYLGDYGNDKSVLWIDSVNYKDIECVIENINTLKELPVFKNIEKIKFAEPTNKELLKYEIKATDKVTKSYKKIYEYKL